MSTSTRFDAGRVVGSNGRIHEAAIDRIAYIRHLILQSYGPLVQSGPFSGMRLEVDTAWHTWSGGIPIPMLIGCYEQQLHNSIEKAISRAPSLVIDVGCADGYYAVGFARRMSHAKVMAFDIDENAQEICREMSTSNNVERNVIISGELTPEALIKIVDQGERSLIFMDCEGFEAKLVCSATASYLRNSDLIIECHEPIAPGSSKGIIDLLESSHYVERIGMGARNAYDYRIFHTLSEIDGWLTMWEGRTFNQNWLACWAK